MYQSSQIAFTFEGDVDLAKQYIPQARSLIASRIEMVDLPAFGGRFALAETVQVIYSGYKLMLGGYAITAVIEAAPVVVQGEIILPTYYVFRVFPAYGQFYGAPGFEGVSEQDSVFRLVGYNTASNQWDRLNYINFDFQNRAYGHWNANDWELQSNRVAYSMGPQRYDTNLLPGSGGSIPAFLHGQVEFGTNPRAWFLRTSPSQSSSVEGPLPFYYVNDLIMSSAFAVGFPMGGSLISYPLSGGGEQSYMVMAFGVNDGHENTSSVSKQMISSIQLRGHDFTGAVPDFSDWAVLDTYAFNDGAPYDSRFWNVAGTIGFDSTGLRGIGVQMEGDTPYEFTVLLTVAIDSVSGAITRGALMRNDAEYAFTESSALTATHTDTSPEAAYHPGGGPWDLYHNPSSTRTRSYSGRIDIGTDYHRVRATPQRLFINVGGNSSESIDATTGLITPIDNEYDYYTSWTGTAQVSGNPIQLDLVYSDNGVEAIVDSAFYTIPGTRTASGGASVGDAVQTINGWPVTKWYMHNSNAFPWSSTWPDGTYGYPLRPSFPRDDFYSGSTYRYVELVHADLRDGIIVYKRLYGTESIHVTWAGPDDSSFRSVDRTGPDSIEEWVLWHEGVETILYSTTRPFTPNTTFELRAFGINSDAFPTATYDFLGDDNNPVPVDLSGVSDRTDEVRQMMLGIYGRTQWVSYMITQDGQALLCATLDTADGFVNVLHPGGNLDALVGINPTPDEFDRYFPIIPLGVREGTKY